MKDSYMGMVFSQGFSVTAWVNTASGKAKTFYNLSDSTGDHPLSALGRRKNISDDLRAAIRCAASEAIAKADAAMAYAQARVRDTPIENLRFAFLATSGRGGHTIYYDDASNSSGSIQGYGLSNEIIAEIHRLKIPYVDTRTIPDDLAFQMVSLPMWPSKPDRAESAPWHGMSYAPIDVLAGMYEMLGATVYNLQTRKPTDEEITSTPLRERLALRGWLSNNEAMVSQAMAMPASA